MTLTFGMAQIQERQIYLTRFEEIATDMGLPVAPAEWSWADFNAWDKYHQRETTFSEGFELWCAEHITGHFRISQPRPLDYATDRLTKLARVYDLSHHLWVGDEQLWLACKRKKFLEYAVKEVRMQLELHRIVAQPWKDKKLGWVIILGK